MRRDERDGPRAAIRARRTRSTGRVPRDVRRDERDGPRAAIEFVAPRMTGAHVKLKCKSRVRRADLWVQSANMERVQSAPNVLCTLHP
jgi:hypothetical protein